MPPRQQRTSNVRGRLQAPNFRPLPDVPWSVREINGTHVTIRTTLLPAKLRIIAPPQIRETTSGFLPTSVAVSGAELVLTYPGTIPVPAHFTMGSTDPGIRSTEGAYLAAFDLTLTVPTQDVIPLFLRNWTAVAEMDGTATFDWFDPTPPGSTLRLDQFWAHDPASLATAMTVGANTVNVTFPGGVTSGDTVAVIAQNLAFYNGDYYTLLPQQFVLP